MKLIAKQAIVAEGVLYKPGQELPQTGIHRVAAWIKNGAAVWTETPVPSSGGDAPPASIPDNAAETGTTGAPDTEAEKPKPRGKRQEG